MGQEQMLNEVVDLGRLQRELMSVNFWGEITIKFQNGNIALIEKKETFKPADHVKIFQFFGELSGE